ncbi:MAG: carboxymuconolactone decarboxylase family protein [Phycisphaeraceae bacterium]|nr:MAG: carboxymuconolactone decarboxylase family protein [Phycisphaeraceae bacterium]
MARLSLIDPASSTGKVKEILDGPLAGKHFNIFKAMANSPAALQAYLGLSGALGHGGLSGKEREVVQLAVGSLNGCGYCEAAHTAIGKSVGLTEAQTIEARRGTMSDPKLNALARFTVAIHEKRGHISDDDIRAFKSAGYGDGHIAEVVAGYALAVYTNYFNHIAQTPIDFPPAPSI